MNNLFRIPISLFGFLLFSGLSIATHAATLQGKVFLDENNNGQWNTGEPLRANTTLYIVDEALESTGQGGFFTTTTDANGHYWSFAHNTGTFRMWTDIPAGMTQTAPVRGDGVYIFHQVTLTNPNQTLNVDFGFTGSTQDDTWERNKDGSVTISNSEFSMRVIPNKSQTQSEMNVSKIGDLYQGTNASATVLVKESATRAGLRNGQEKLTIVTGKELTGTGKESIMEATAKPDGSYTIRDADSPTTVATLNADSTYTVKDTEFPGVTVTVNPDGSSKTTDEAFPGMVATLSHDGQTTVTDETFPGMAATVNNDGSYTVTDKEFPDLVTTVNEDGSYTFIDAESPTTRVTRDAEGNYIVTDSDFPSMMLTVYDDGSYMLTDDEGLCFAVEPTNTRGFFSKLKKKVKSFFKKAVKVVKKVVGKVARVVSKVSGFVKKVARFVGKIATVVHKVASVVQKVATFIAPFVPFACKFICTVAAFAGKVANISGKVAQYANKVAKYADKVQKGADKVAIWVRTRMAMIRQALRRPAPIPSDCPTPPLLALDYVTASSSTDTLRLNWATLIESKNTGFNLWRAEKNEADEFINITKVNDSLILAKNDANFGASYSFEDYRAIPNVTYYYTIEDIDIDGESTRHNDMTVAVKPLESLAPATCLLYGVQDRALNDSIFFSLEPETFNVSQLGTRCKGCDIEAMDIHPETNILYVASGNDTFGHPKGHLYKLDAKTGELVSIGATGFKEISSLAFDRDGLLWAWAKDAGLVQLEPATGEGTLVLESEAKLADLTWSLDSTTLYGSVGKTLWTYDPATNSVEQVCNNLPKKTEALEVLPTSILPEGFLLLGSHKNQTLKLQAFDVDNCRQAANQDIAMPYDDPEGLAMPLAACQ